MCGKETEAPRRVIYLIRRIFGGLFAYSCSLFAGVFGGLFAHSCGLFAAFSAYFGAATEMLSGNAAPPYSMGERSVEETV